MRPLKQLYFLKFFKNKVHLFSKRSGNVSAIDELSSATIWWLSEITALVTGRTSLAAAHLYSPSNF